MRMSQASLFVLVLAIFVSRSVGVTRAQEDPSPDGLRAQAAAYADLKFSNARSLGFFSTLGNSVFRPDGVGPFPALVLVHTCGGINDRSTYWTETFLKRGYAVLVIDSLGPRDVKTNCGRPRRRVTPARGVKDAFDALGHLQKLDVVDARRIGLVGMSWGGAVGHRASSKLWAEALSGGSRFGAIATLYGNCRTPSGNNHLRDDVDRPLLVLMGDADTETPPTDCMPKLHILKERGAPVEWHVYPGATHAWDRHSKEATDDSGRRIFDFMERHLGK
jgi:dienelactone hydrolase